MKGYGEYKKIDAQWIEKIPSHWDVVRNKFILRERKKFSSTDSETLLSVSQYSGVTKKNFEKSVGIKAAESLVGYKIVKQHDIVMNIMLAWNGSTGVSRYEGVVSPAYAVFEAVQAANPYFLHYVFRCPLVTEYFKAYSTGIVDSRLRLYPEKMAALMTVLPPREEQDQIVRYLDAKVGKINKLIRIKQKQIALLKEKKQAIINQAVTKGLDPNAPMKDSGIVWIGQIPEGWEVTPLKKIATIQSGITLGKSYSSNNVHTYPYMCVANVQNGFLDLSKVKNIQVPEHEASRHMLQKNDVLMTEGGDPDKLGRGCLWNGELERCLHQNHIFVVRSDSTQIPSQYLCLFLSSSLSQRYFLLTSKQTTNLASTNKTKLGSLPIPLPSIEEQKSILRQLQKGLSRCEALLTTCVHKIATLTEYRTRLISDVVTGKVDVRHLPIPDCEHAEFDGIENPISNKDVTRENNTESEDE